jgi:hypothetical protein
LIDKIFPKELSNTYQGKTIAKWVFIAMVVMTIARSLAHIFLPDGGAQSIATIPLGAFSPDASAVVIGMFAQWGLTQLMFAVLYVLVLLRYQSLIPLMWLFILIEYSGRLLLAFAKPFETKGQAPGAIGNYIFIPLALLMLTLSLKEQKSV